MVKFGEAKYFKVKGGHFSGNYYFSLFSHAVNNKINLLYGRNGAGKSTVAKGFREIGMVEPEIELTLYSEDKIIFPPNQMQELSQKVFVFDDG